MLGMDGPASLDMIDAGQVADEVHGNVDVELDEPDDIDEAGVIGGDRDGPVEGEIEVVADRTPDDGRLLELVDGCPQSGEIALGAARCREDRRLRLDHPPDLQVVEQDAPRSRRQFARHVQRRPRLDK